MQPENPEPVPGSGRSAGREQASQHALRIFQHALSAVDPAGLVKRQVQPVRHGLQFGESVWTAGLDSRIHVVGAGKAAVGMCAGLWDAINAAGLDPERVSGQLNVPEGCAAAPLPFRTVTCRPAGENLPTAAAVAATREIRSELERARPGDLIVALISGGGSSVLACPAAGISLEDKRRLIRWLDRSGADIAERNLVRRECSAVKGGRLVSGLPCRTVRTLVLSDILGNPLELVASGPTIPVPPDPSGALAILEKWVLVTGDREGIPEAVWDHLRRAAAGKSAVNHGQPRAGSASLASSMQTAGAEESREGGVALVGSLETAVAAAAGLATGFGYSIETRIQTDPGESVDEVARRLMDWLSLPLPGPRVLIDAGEPVVRLGANPGRGGRNQHLVLTAALLGWERSRLLSGALPREFCLLSGGTDGEDGNTPVAGAMINADWMERWQSREQSGREHAAAWDSYSFLAPTGAILGVGPTGTNVGDLRVVVVPGQAEPGE